MTDVRHIEVYCDGPSQRAGHERYLIVSYGRVDDDAFPRGRDWVPNRVWVDAEGKQRLARTHDVHPKQGAKPLLAPGVPNSKYLYRFRCPRCGFDEQRKLAGNADTALPSVLDQLSDNGVDEIAVRMLVRLVWE